MNRFKYALVACVVVSLGITMWGGEAKTNKVLRMAVDLADGSHLVGIPAINSIRLQTPYALVDIPLVQTRSITLEKDRESAVFEMVNGDRIKGAMLFEKLDLQTAFGKVSIGAGQINSIIITVAGKGTAVGGTITTNGGYIIHTFTNVGTTNFVVSEGSLNCEVLVVAGGGAGGGGWGGAGGGAGGLLTNSVTVSGTTTVAVGIGGKGVVSAGGLNGANSFFGTIVAIGGGGGGKVMPDYPGKAGGSGGGGIWNWVTMLPGNGTLGQGHAGGEGVVSNVAGGGGGGKGEPGHQPSGPLYSPSVGASIPGAGGDGFLNSYSGAEVYYAGGGGGAGGNPGYIVSPAAGGLGGGGNGGTDKRAGSYTPPTAGAVNTGGGGGGARNDQNTGANGGSGIVIVRYRQ